MEDSGARQSELSYEEHCRILDEITENGCLWLLYTGGEIFAREDFLDIYTYARQKGLLVTLFTNGTLITPQVADHLARLTPFSIEITLYGRTKKTYERITGVPGSFEKCLRGIRLLRERDLPLRIKTMAVTANKHEIWEMKQFVRQELGLEFRFDAMINPRFDRSQLPLAFRLTPAEVVELDLFDSARIDAWKSFACQYNGPAHSSAGCDEMYHCGGGINSFCISPQGKVSLCELSRFHGCDLRQQSFKDAWENSLLSVRRKKISRTSKCVSCGIKAMCGMCPANGELEKGDPESPVDFLCQVAHLRSYALGIQVGPHGECEYCIGGSKYGQMMGLADYLRENTSDQTPVRPALQASAR
jgi:radical SAM protein with 4Fe4S-binding SPASM domain